MRRTVFIPRSASASRGTSMIELLSAMVVVSIGLLGISNLQSKALKSSQDSYFVSQATFFLDDIAERIRANHASGNSAAANYNFVTAMKTYAELTTGQQGRSCVGNAVTCTPAQMAEYDVARWLNAMTNGNRALPSAAGMITWSGTTATITIRWKAIYTENGNCDSAGTLNGATQDYRCVTSTVALS